MVFIPALAPPPQTDGNRTRRQLVEYMEDYTGGKNSPKMDDKAVRALDATIREFNRFSWKFNRLVSDVTLVNKTLSDPEYTLAATDFKMGKAARFLDVNNVEVGRNIYYVPWEIWIRTEPDLRSIGPMPRIYTARNFHENLKIQFDPTTSTSGAFPYPKIRLYYFRRILKPGNDDAVINVPEEVEEAIVQEALAKLMDSTRSFAEAREAHVYADDLFLDVARAHRDWEDF